MKMSFVLNCGVYSKTGKWVFSRKCDNDSNSGYVPKWKPYHCLENGQEIFKLKRTPIRFLKKFKIGNCCSRHV